MFLPILIVLCDISNAQRITIAGLDFPFSRLLVITVWLRIFIRQELEGFKFCKADMLLLMWLMARTFVYGLQWGDRQAVILQLGSAFTTCGFYFMARVFIRDIEDIKQFGRQLALIALPTAIFFAIEWVTARNYFSIFGGVELFSRIREGRLRCTGAFTHPLIAGYFWGVAIPFMATLFDSKGWHRKIAYTGISSALMIVVSTASSTPILGLFAFGLGWCFYFIRSLILYIILGTTLTIGVLHIYMRAPVWHLISRINVIGGSTGAHRYRLINAFLTNVSDWFFLGYKYTGNWGYGLDDVTNEFIVQGVRGGIVTLVLFVIFMGYVMALLQRRTRQASEVFSERFVTWNIWAALFMQGCIFFALAIFGQAALMFYLTLGTAVSLSLCAVAVPEKPGDKAGGKPKSSFTEKKQKIKQRLEGGGWIMPQGQGSDNTGGWM